MSTQVARLCLVAAALAGTGISGFRGVSRLAASTRNTNTELLVYFSNGNEIGLLRQGASVPLDLDTGLGTGGSCCPHHATPSLAHDGQRIAYVRLASSQPRREVINIYDLESKKQEEVFAAEAVWGISWAPDGSRLAIVADREADRSHNLYVLNLRSTAATQLSHGSLEIEGARYTVSNHVSPSWNRSATQLAIEVRPEHPENNQASAIVLWDLATNQFHKLTEGGSPSWSPAQDMIALVEPGGRKCWSIQADGNNRKLLFALAESAPLLFPVVWSPDGNQLLFHKSVDADLVTEIYKFDLQTGKSRLLARTEVQVVNWRERR